MSRYKMITDLYRDDWRNDVGLNKLTACINGPIAAIDRLEEKHKQLSRGNRLTEVGLAEEMRNFAKTDTTGVLRRAQNVIKDMRSDLDRSKVRLRVPAPDKSDIAAAILRMDMRNWLKSLGNRGELMAILLDKDAPEVLLQAAYEVPPVMINADAEIMEQIQERLIEIHHGPIVKQIEEIDEAITVADGVVQLALQDVRAMLKFDEHNDHVFTSWFDHVGYAIDREFEQDRARKLTAAEELAKTAVFLTPRPPTLADRRADALQAKAYTWDSETGGLVYHDTSLNVAA